MRKALSLLMKLLTGAALAAVIMVLIWQQSGKDPRVEAKRLWGNTQVLYKRMMGEEVDNSPSESPEPQELETGQRVRETYNALAFECPPKPQAKSPDTGRSVFVWRDEAGKTHFSDVRPRDQAHSKVEGVGSRRQYFDLVFQEGRSALPSRLLDRISADTYQIFDVLYRDLASVEHQVVTLNLRLFANRADYLALQKTAAPNLSRKAVGFYTGRANYAAIDASGPVDLTTAVILHESTHALISNIFGFAPIWLNEGMAMYFESMQVTGQLRQINPNPFYIRFLARGAGIRFKRLEQYFAVSGSNWYAAEESDHNYAVAWSLVYHLMSDERGKEFLSKMMVTMADNYCRQLNAAPFIEDHYPGGLVGLERDWKTRIKTNDWRPHRY